MIKALVAVLVLGGGVSVVAQAGSSEANAFLATELETEQRFTGYPKNVIVSYSSVDVDQCIPSPDVIFMVLADRIGRIGSCDSFQLAIRHEQYSLLRGRFGIDRAFRPASWADAAHRLRFEVSSERRPSVSNFQVNPYGASGFNFAIPRFDDYVGSMLTDGDVTSQGIGLASHFCRQGGLLCHRLSGIGRSARFSESNEDQDDTDAREERLSASSPEHPFSPFRHALLGLQVALFALGIAICVLGFRFAAFAARRRRDIHILSGAGIAFVGAGIASWAVTWALTGSG